MYNVLEKLRADEALNAKEKQIHDPRRKLAWPKTLAERVKAVSAALAAAQNPVSPADIAARFTRAKPADVAEILETHSTMGHAHCGQVQGTYLP